MPLLKYFFVVAAQFASVEALLPPANFGVGIALWWNRLGTFVTQRTALAPVVLAGRWPLIRGVWAALCFVASITFILSPIYLGSIIGIAAHTFLMLSQPFESAAAQTTIEAGFVLRIVGQLAQLARARAGEQGQSFKPSYLQVLHLYSAQSAQLHNEWPPGFD